MEEEYKFASFDPVLGVEEVNKEKIAKYYRDNNIVPDNDYMKKFLELEAPKKSTYKENAPTEKQTFDIGEIMSGVLLKRPNESSAPTNYVKGSYSTPSNPKEFLKMYGEVAKKAAKETGISEDLMLAQIALESGWGKSTPGYNLGGIKADPSWKGKRNRLMTTEYDKKKGYYKTPQDFRAYDTPEEGFRGYVDFLMKNKRYKPIIGVDDPFLAAEIMSKTGYATDVEYNQKLKNMVQSVIDWKKKI